jgi:alpha-L-fucosidase 2
MSTDPQVNAESFAVSRRGLLMGSLLAAASGAFGSPSFGSASVGGTSEFSLASDSPSSEREDLKLWYDERAVEWTQALPLGNGRIGAMVFGDALNERYQLNESTLWGGGPHDYTNPEGLAALPRIRQLVFEGKFGEAQRLVDEHFLGRPAAQMPYQPVGNLRLDYLTNDDRTPKLSEFRRELDLDSAIHTVSFRADGMRVRRESFMSAPDQVLVVRISNESEGKISTEIVLDSPHRSRAASHGTGTIALTGISGDVGDIPGRVKFAALARVIPQGGRIVQDDHRLLVTDADSLVLLLAIATSYRSYKDVDGNAMAIAQDHLDRATLKSFEDLRSAHLRDHRRLFRGVELSVGPSDSATPTDRRIETFSQANDPGLAALYFQYGRYQMISSSRPGGQPANLQGIWNDSLTPPWGSKFTTNINTEMNYWPAETCGLSECHEPLFAMISDLSETGSEVAKVMYGAPGWVFHHNADGWRGAAPVDFCYSGMWQTGGAWLCTHLWQRYLFQGDLAGLKSHYPLMKGAAEFFLATLVVDPSSGHLVTCPSNSPENAHHPGVSICAGPSMDMSILRDLFHACAEASKLLNVDEPFRTSVLAAREKLAPLKIGAAGQLQEWQEDWDVQAPERHHRHVSHLYALFPSNQISIQTPELMAAAKKTLEMRGDLSTGWSLAWKLNLWARLHDGDHCHKLIQDALTPIARQVEGGGVYPNLFDAHPPFQIDGNFGFASGVAEMLLQSHLDELHLLPALPSAWPTGHIRGLRARGGYVVDLDWENGSLKTARIKCPHPGSVSIRLGEKVKRYATHPVLKLDSSNMPT